jgi:hypothetical protein
MKRKNTIIILTVILMVTMSLLLTAGCARFRTERGVEDRWRAGNATVFTQGTSTQSDVLKALGPPSQIISLKNGPVFYYLREQGQGNALVLIVYNKVKYEVKYDRAIFFFDREGRLTDHAYSHSPSSSQ